MSGRAGDRFAVAVSLVVALVLSVAGGTGRGAPRRQHGSDWVAPPAAGRRANPLAGRLDVVAGGEKIFEQRCATCHGTQGTGGAKAPPLADPAVLAQTDGALFWKISTGNSRAGMPAFSYLPELQRWQIVLALRRLPRLTMDRR